MSIKIEKPEEDQGEASNITFTPPPTTSPTPPLATPPPSGDWRELREQERAERRAAKRAARHSGSYGWVGGAVLILLGAIFLLQNMGLITNFANWWALFLLIPAASALITAWNLYQQADQQWTSAATGSLIGGGILLLLAAAFLFGFDFGLVWPFLLIAGGLALLLRRGWQ
ncbi:MAG: hypothetical protein R3C14_28275 [Caldilineaceae bacterium]